MKRLVISVAALLCVGTLAGALAVNAAAPNQSEPQATSTTTQFPTRYGYGGKISAIKPPGDWTQSGGPPDTHSVLAPFAALDIPTFGVDKNLAPGNEVVIASNPANPLNFLAGANTTGRFTTTDGGVTWSVGNLTGGGDPVTAFDAAGRAYFALLGNTSSCPDNPYFYRSTDGGFTFTGPTLPITDPVPGEHFFDKEWMAVDNNPTSPYFGRIYYTVTNFRTPPGCNLNNYIDSKLQLVYSDNQGTTWSAPTLINDASHDQNQFTHPVAARDGTLYVGYQYQNCTFNCTSSIPMVNLIAKSTDGGVSFSPSITITGQPIVSTGSFVNGYQYLYAGSTTAGFRHNDQAIIGVSPTNPNEVYAVWTDGRWDTSFVYQTVTGQHGDIASSRSTDGGNTWTAPIRVNDDAMANGKDQFFPWMVVGTDGVIHASWSDRRDSTGFQYREYYSQSTDGGLTWATNVPVGDVGGTPGSFIGDYSGLAVNSDNTLVLPIWTDSRSGTRAYTDRGVLTQGTPVPTTLSTSTPTGTSTHTVLPTPTISCGLAWRVVSSPNNGSSGNYLTSLTVVSHNDIWAVGYYGSDPNQQTLIIHWDGGQWSIVPSPNPTTFENILYDVEAVSANDVWAVGVTSNNTLALHWDGSNWTQVSTPNPGSSSNLLYDIDMVSANDIWAVGEYSSPGSIQTLTLHWDGSGWTHVVSPNIGAGANTLRSVVALSANDVWAAGVFNDGSSSRTLILHWDGSQWSTSPTPNVGSDNNILYGLAGVSSNDLWAVGHYSEGANTRTLILRWNGSSWAIIPSPNPGTVYNLLYGVSAVSSNNIWAVGHSYSGGPTGRVLILHWDGGSWSSIPSPNLIGNGYDVFAISSNNVWTVGNYSSNPSRTLVERYYDPCVTPTSTVVPPTSTATRTNTSVAPTSARTNTAVTTGTAAPPTSTSTTVATAKATATSCTVTFSDVDETNTFYTWIRCLACRGIISGYSDGTFRPNAEISRGQIAKMVSNSTGFGEDPGSQIYEDVPSASPFYAWINRLSMRGHMGGYNCGIIPEEPCGLENLPYFRPSASATRGQLAKIVSNAAGLTGTHSGIFYTDVQEDNPFYVWIMRLTTLNVMGGYPCGGPNEPCDESNRPYFRPYATVTRGQASKIVANTFFPGCLTPR